MTIGGGKCYYIANIVVHIIIIVMVIISSFITFGNKNYSNITIQKKDRNATIYTYISSMTTMLMQLVNRKYKNCRKG